MKKHLLPFARLPCALIGLVRRAQIKSLLPCFIAKYLLLHNINNSERTTQQTLILRQQANCLF